MTMYLIVGETGEQDDYRTWNVAASVDHMKIHAHVIKLTKFLTDHNIPNDKADFYDASERPNNPNDPGLEKNWQGSGVEYKIEKIKSLDKLRGKL